MIDWLDRKITLCVNRSLINKNDSGNPKAFLDFKPEILTIEGLSDSIRNGFAYCSAMVGRRSSENFSGSDIVSVDVDSGMSLADARQHPLVDGHATLIYTTASHTELLNRFRIVFVLEEAITNAIEFTRLASILAQRLCGDMKVLDAGRLFYGNTRAEFTLYNKGLNFLQVTELLRESGENDQWTVPTHPFATIRSSTRIPPQQQILTKANGSRPLSQIFHGTSVHCPFHDDSNASAVVYENRRGKFIKCFACNETFWPSLSNDEYAFDGFERAVLAASELGERQLQIDNEIWSLTSLSLLHERHLPRQPLQHGVTFIKSSKGTGKTQFVAEGVHDAGQNARILVIGHRVTLVRAMCNRLALNCYLDDRTQRDYRRVERYGICLDSLWKLKNPPSYDIVVMDECEQVLGHFASETMNGKRHTNLRCLTKILASAKKIVALDADISMFSFENILKMAELDGPRERHVILNQYRPDAGRKLEVFASRNHLAGDLVESVKSGKRCYVVSNSKKLVDRLSTSILAHGPDISLLLVTSDNSAIANGPAGAFISDPVEQAERYQIILSSPSVSSGVDLSFPGGEAFYDVVYGFFEGGVTNHFDCDQQMARVRNPRVAKVFVSPAQQLLEHDPGVVKSELIDTPMFGHLISGFGDEEDVNEDDPVLHLLVSIEARRRASINYLRRNYIDYKVRSGFEIQNVPVSSEFSTIGKQYIAAGKIGTEERRVLRLLNAQKLQSTQLRSLIKKQLSGKELTSEESAQVERARIENFYRRDIFDGLIELDESGAFAEKVWMFEALSMNQDREIRKPADIFAPSFAGKSFFLARALREAGALSDQGFVADTVLSDKTLGNFQAFMADNKAIYEALFKRPLRTNFETAPMSQLRDLIKHCFLKTESSGTHTVNGRKTYLYKIHNHRLKAMQSLMRVRQRKQTRWPEIDTPPDR